MRKRKCSHWQMRRLNHIITKKLPHFQKKIDNVDSSEDNRNDDSDDDSKCNSNGEEFDARKFHGGVVGLNDVDDDYYDNE